MASLLQQKRDNIPTKAMIHNLSQLKLEELHELFLCETKHFLEGLEKNIPHNELASIRHTIKQVMAEIEKRKKVKC